MALFFGSSDSELIDSLPEVPEVIYGYRASLETLEVLKPVSLFQLVLVFQRSMPPQVEC